MLINTNTRTFSAAVVSSLVGWRRLAAALVTATALLLATAGSAAAYTPNPIPLNKANWSGKACCGASAPAWYTDAFGIVHLEGAATQTSAKGSNAPLLGTLPVAARPTREVFTIVHTKFGTYADLAIDPNGKIGVIGPRAPAVQDLSFVSLEGISYQPANKLPAALIAMKPNWSANAGFGSTAPAAYKDGSGIVHLEGAATQTSAGGLIGTLPAGAVPVRPLSTIVHTSFGTYAVLSITTSGDIYSYGPPAPAVTDLSFLSLEGVSYNPGAIFNHIANVNTSNWSPASVSGSQDPGWVQDSAGVVHLQGAVTQTSSAGSNANLIATLPAVVRPTRNIYTIVQTDFGTYTDLTIDTNGQIWVIGPRPPAAEFLSYLSLEGITYQPTDTAGPHALSLTRGGNMVALLHKPRKLKLFVFALGPQAHLLGALTLGHHPAGRSRIRWDLRVGGHRLPAGTYIAELVAVPGRGSTSGGPGVTFAVTRTGRIRVLSSTCSVAAANRNRC